MLGPCRVAPVSRNTWRPRTIQTSGRSRCAHLLAAVLVSGFVGSLARADAGFEPVDHAIHSIVSNQRVETLIRDWFASLARPAIDPNPLSGFLSEASFEFRSADETVRDRREFLASISDLRATRPNAEYELDSIEVESVEPDLYRARFEFNTRNLDEAGIPHVSRREHIWMVRSRPNEMAKVLRIDERPLLAFSGTGPQIVCY